MGCTPTSRSRVGAEDIDWLTKARYVSTIVAQPVSLARFCQFGVEQADEHRVALSRAHESRPNLALSKDRATSLLAGLIAAEASRIIAPKIVQRRVATWQMVNGSWLRREWCPPVPRCIR